LEAEIVLIKSFKTTQVLKRDLIMVSPMEVTHIIGLIQLISLAIRDALKKQETLLNEANSSQMVLNIQGPILIWILWKIGGKSLRETLSMMNMKWKC